MPSASKYDSYLPAIWLDSKWCSKGFFESKIYWMICEKDWQGLQEGKELEDIEVKFGLTTLKPLHTS